MLVTTSNSTFQLAASGQAAIRSLQAHMRQLEERRVRGGITRISIETVSSTTSAVCHRPSLP